MNPTSFAESLGVSVTVIFNIIKGRRSKPSYELIAKMLRTYDKVNAEWLIKGDGPMWNDDVVTSDKFVPSNIHLESRIRELFLKIKIAHPESYEVDELEELVLHLLRETVEQKNRLVLLNERKEGMIRVLRDKLKLKL